jgi:ergothioneine biosynthesis protein EgtB
MSRNPPRPVFTSPQETLSRRYRAVRDRSEKLCAPLSIEDHVPQPMADVSPPKWHLAHTAWFFETLLLQPHHPGYRCFNDRFGYLFNSYYETHGERVTRAHRGHLSRPTVDEVLDYRAHVDSAMSELLARPLAQEVAALVELGLQHEQQHQELLLTDIKFILGNNPLAPAYDPEGRSDMNLDAEHEGSRSQTDEWVMFEGGTVEVGHTGNNFAFDNEAPRHALLVPPVALRAALITNTEYLAFMDDGGYERFEFWHADGWDWVQNQPHRAPLYWQRDPQRPGQWLHYTLGGLRPLEDTAPLTHISHYEAHAFCCWAGYRLPTEFEWEVLAPRLNKGQRWEWTASAYQPYPGFRPAMGAVGEYNGKFMINQMVLRGSSFATPPDHARLTYRNFFQPPARWQYTGIRPARSRE